MQNFTWGGWGGGYVEGGGCRLQAAPRSSAQHRPKEKSKRWGPAALPGTDTHRPTPPVRNAARGRTKDKGRKWGRGEEMEERSATFCATLRKMPRASLCPEPLFPRRCSGTTQPPQAPRAAGGAPHPAALPSPASQGSQASRSPWALRPGSRGAAALSSPPPHATRGPAAPQPGPAAAPAAAYAGQWAPGGRRPGKAESGRLASPGRPSRPRTTRGGAGPGASFPQPFPPRGAGHLHGCGSPGRRWWEGGGGGRGRSRGRGGKGGASERRKGEPGGRAPSEGLTGLTAAAASSPSPGGGRRAGSSSPSRSRSAHGAHTGCRPAFPASPPRSCLWPRGGGCASRLAQQHPGAAGPSSPQPEPGSSHTRSLTSSGERPPGPTAAAPLPARPAAPWGRPAPPRCSPRPAACPAPGPASGCPPWEAPTSRCQSPGCGSLCGFSWLKAAGSCRR